MIGTHAETMCRENIATQMNLSNLTEQNEQYFVTSAYFMEGFVKLWYIFRESMTIICQGIIKIGGYHEN